MSGLVKFDHQGFRSDFLLNIVELTSEGLQDIGTWNASEGLNITRQQLGDKMISGDKGSWANRTFIVLTALVSVKS